MLSSLKVLTVLYVDDDTVACKNMKNTLTYFFKEVYTANNGAQALKIFQQKNINVLLVDYDMPIMNGYDFLKEIRSIDTTIPALMISSYSDKEKLLSAIRLNLVAYLIKPLEFKELKNALFDIVSWMEKYNPLRMKLFENCYYDFMTKNIYVDDESIANLTHYEYKVFEYLLKHSDKIVLYDAIFDLLDNDEMSKRSLSSIIYKINKKMPTSVIKNIKDVGYTVAGLA